jgi:hypothetical protein
MQATRGPNPNIVHEPSLHRFMNYMNFTVPCAVSDPYSVGTQKGGLQGLCESNKTSGIIVGSIENIITLFLRIDLLIYIGFFIFPLQEVVSLLPGVENGRNGSCYPC